MTITPHFKREEFDCTDSAPYPDKWIESRLRPLCEDLEKIREESGVLVINSGYRTAAYNKAIRGAAKSQHVQGLAADLHPKKVYPKELHAIILRKITLKEIRDGGVGLYSWGVHYDHGPARRWLG